MSEPATSASAEAAISGLFSQASHKTAERGSRWVWVFVGLIVLLAILGMYVFWYLMCKHRGGTARGLKCDCGPNGKYNFLKFGCDCTGGSQLLAGTCTAPTAPPPTAASLQLCGDVRPASGTKNDAQTCCLFYPPATGIVGDFCGSAPGVSVPVELEHLSAPGIARFSPTALDIRDRNQPHGRF